MGGNPLYGFDPDQKMFFRSPVLVPNYTNLTHLHNWMYENRKDIQYHAGIWVGKYTPENPSASPVFWFDGDNADKFDVASAFGWAAMSDTPALSLVDSDIQDYGMWRSVCWTGYLKRVFGLDMGMPEYNFIDSHRWRKVDNSVDGAIARIRYVLDNPLDTPTNSEVVDMLSDPALIPYDTLENRPYEEQII